MDKIFAAPARLLAVCFLSLTLLLAACAQEVTPTPAMSGGTFPVPLNPTVAAEAPFTLKVWFAEDYYNEAPITSLIAEFQQAYPKIKVEIDHAQWEKIPAKLKAAVDFGQPPDVVHQHAFALGAQGYAEPLTELWQRWGLQSKFLPSALQDTTWNGISYGVPLDINCTFLIYNKAFFQEAGLPLPTDNYTYTQLLADAKKLTKPELSRYGVAFNNGVWNMFGHLRSNGGNLLVETNSPLKAVLDDPANLEMLQYIGDAINQSKVALKLPITRDGFDPVSSFAQGKVAMFFTGPWDLKTIQQTATPELYAQVGTAMMPSGMNGGTTGSVQGGGSLFVPKGSKHREAAFEFMKWATSDKYQMRLAKEMARFPVITSLYNDQYFTSQTLLQPFFKQLATSRPYKLEAYPEAELSWEGAIYSILSGTGGDTATILKQANQEAQKAINLATRKT